jgi:hypothetical protein
MDREGADAEAFRRDEFQSFVDFCHGIFRAILQRAMLAIAIAIATFFFRSF